VISRYVSWLFNRLSSLLIGALLLLGSALLTLSQAQITLDGSLRRSGPVAGPNYVIDAAIGQLRGSHLFHSFGEFSMRTGESATYTGPNTIANILSRITGGNPSCIDGVIRSTISKAYLYLLNPAAARNRRRIYCALY
jgi:filamentous hemagglutinin family protein